MGHAQVGVILLPAQISHVVLVVWQVKQKLKLHAFKVKKINLKTNVNNLKFNFYYFKLQGQVARAESV